MVEAQHQTLHLYKMLNICSQQKPLSHPLQCGPPDPSLGSTAVVSTTFVYIWDVVPISILILKVNLL